jgi:hypothetical protein
LSDAEPRGAKGGAIVHVCVWRKVSWRAQEFLFSKSPTTRSHPFLAERANVSSDGQERVQPFRKLTLAMLPCNLNAIFRTQWLPIFKCLQEVLTPLSTETFENDEDEIEKKYKRWLAHLKERVSYCWNKTDPTKFTLATWLNKTSWSAIMKCGNSGDCEKLSKASNCNCV